MLLKWGPENELGIKIIDEQHKRFVGILNMLEDALMNFKTEESIQGVLDELNFYTTYHFKTEEDYFDKFGYEGAEIHKAVHREFKDKISDLKKTFWADKQQLSIKLIDYLEDWLISHVDNMDRKYVKCFKDHGLE